MAISEKTRKILWGRSGNRCAICKTELVLEKDPFSVHLNIGEECHIISRQPNGPRFEQLDSFDYDSSENLLLLCCNHHKMVDEQIKTYPKDKLKGLKVEHELWVKSNLDGNNRFDESEEKSKRSLLIEFVTGKHDIEMNIKAIKQVFESSEGLQIAFSEIAKIKGSIIETVNALNESAPNYCIQFRDNKQHICDIRFKGHTLLVQFYQAYSNVADESYLLFGIIDGLFNEQGYADIFYPAKPVKIIRLNFSFDDNGIFGWRDQEIKTDFYTSEKIAEIWIEKFFKYVLK